MSRKNETSSLMQNRRDQDDGIYETYGYATESKDKEDYETPYKEDQYEQPYKGHAYAEYEKPKNETRQIKKKKILLVLVIALLIAGLAAGIGSYFTLNHEDSEPSESSTESSTEISTKNCEFDKNDECLDAVCSEKCSQCKNYRLNSETNFHNETCIPPEGRECVLDGWCDAERRRGYTYNHAMPTVTWYIMKAIIYGQMDINHFI